MRAGGSGLVWALGAVKEGTMHGWTQSQGQGTIHSCADSFLALLLITMLCLRWSTIDSKVPSRVRKVGQAVEKGATRPPVDQDGRRKMQGQLLRLWLHKLRHA